MRTVNRDVWGVGAVHGGIPGRCLVHLRAAGAEPERNHEQYNSKAAIHSLLPDA
jgi:hypothetical protein